MTRPDPLIRPMIQLSPMAESPRDPNQWLRIAAVICFAIGAAVAIQL